MMEKREIAALIQLIDDPDEYVFNHVRSKILEIGPTVIEDLEDAWETNIDPFFQQRVELIINQIQRDNLKQKLSLWLQKNNTDLIQGATLLAKFQYPDLQTGEIKAEIESLKKSIWLELKENLTPLERVNTFNQIFYGEFGFGGNLKNVFNPQNNFIHTTLERKKGSPIMLGIIYLAVAQALNLPMLGVNLPYHFALAYCKIHLSQFEEVKPNPDSTVIFYVNPISRGRIFSRVEINDYLERMKLSINKDYFKPVENKMVIHALFLHLKDCYIKNNDAEKANELQEFIDLFG